MGEGRSVVRFYLLPLKELSESRSFENRWRWRESNPRPEAHTKNLYRFSCCLLQRGKHNSSSLKLAVCRIKFPYLYAALQAGESRFVTSIPELGTAPRVPVTANYAASANSGLLAVIIVPLLGDWRSTCNPWSTKPQSKPVHPHVFQINSLYHVGPVLPHALNLVS